MGRREINLDQLFNHQVREEDPFVTNFRARNPPLLGTPRPAQRYLRDLQRLHQALLQQQRQQQHQNPATSLRSLQCLRAAQKKGIAQTEKLNQNIQNSVMQLNEGNRDTSQHSTDRTNSGHDLRANTPIAEHFQASIQGRPCPTGKEYFDLHPLLRLEDIAEENEDLDSP